MKTRMTIVTAALVLVVALALSAGAASGAGSVCPATNHPNELLLAGGSGQTGQLGKPFPASFQVKLANTNGCPLTGNLAGITVEFDAPGSGASGIFPSSGSRVATVGTDSQGMATAPPFTANYTTGNYSVDAHSDYGSVEIGLSNTANGLPAVIAAQATGQEAAVNTQYTQPLQVRITDANGNPVQGASVSFAVVPGPTGAGASFLGAPNAVTNADGVATSPPLLANAVPGRFAATASTDGLAAIATFALDNHAAAMTVAAVTASDPAATVDSRYAQPLQARVVDAGGQPVEGASVTFAISPADNGAGASFLGGGTQATALTGADGIALSPPFVANKTAGAFTATAATAAGARPLAFTLTNRAAAPHAVAAGAASGGSSIVGTRFPVPLAVTVTDLNGNPVAGATVVFAAPKKGASGRFPHRKRIARVKTNANGIAIAPAFTANASAGGYVVTAVVKGTPVRAAFALVNRPR